jgi:hypothetical protein
MQIGSKVARKDSPAIAGVVLARCDGKAEVRWTTHTTTWADASTLVHALPQPKGQNQHG